MSRKAKIEGYAYDVAKRSNSTDSRSAAAEQAHRRRSVTASYRAEPRSAAWCGKRAPTPEPTATAASTTSAAPGKRQCAQTAPHTRSWRSWSRAQTRRQQYVGQKDDALCRPGSYRHYLYRRRRSVFAGSLPQHHHRRRRRLVLQRFICRHQGQLGMEAL